MNVIAMRDSFKTEISSYDVLTGRADRFGEGEYDNRYVLAPPDRPTLCSSPPGCQDAFSYILEFVSDGILRPVFKYMLRCLSNRLRCNDISSITRCTRRLPHFHLPDIR